MDVTLPVRMGREAAIPLRQSSIPAFSGKKPKDKDGNREISLAYGLTWYAVHPRSLRAAINALEWLGLKKAKGPIPAWDKFPVHKEIKRIDFNSLDGSKLKGYWLKAPQKSEVTVILGHGFLGNARMFLPVLERLRNEGFNAFLFDFRAHGESEGEISTLGHYEGRDLAAAVKYVTEQHPFASKKLFYMGHSMGAATMMLTPKSLADYPEALQMLNQRLSGMILDSPFYKISPSNFQHIRNWMARVPENRILKKLHRFFFEKFGPNLKESMIRQSVQFIGLPIDTVRTGKIFATHPLSNKPLLLMHGTKDSITPFDHALDISNALKDNPNLRMVPLEGKGHRNLEWKGLGNGKQYTVVNRGGERYFEEVINFLRRYSASPDLEPGLLGNG